MSTSRIGRYEILRPLGRGAMGLVYLARDPQIEREVALKTVRFDGPGSSFNVDESKARFLKEARISGRLQHPHIVTVFDVGEDQGTLYLAMEYVSGGSLSQRLTKGDPVSLEDRVRIVSEVAAALAHAHERGVIHRDIKPANILLTEALAAKVTDFGIGKLIVGDTDLTSTGQMVGSPSYMSPEQIRGEKLDVRSDIFSLGVVLYQTLTERKPFPADTLTTLVYQILHEEPPDPNVLRNNLPPGISDIVKKCLAKSRDDRYMNAAELADDLAAVIGMPIEGGTVGLSESVVKRRARTGSTQPNLTRPAEATRSQDQPTMPSGERPAQSPEPAGAGAPDETLVSASHPSATGGASAMAATGGGAPPSTAERSGSAAAAAAPTPATPPPAKPAGKAPPSGGKPGGKGPVIGIAIAVAVVLGFFALKGKKTAVDVPPTVIPVARPTRAEPTAVVAPTLAVSVLPTAAPTMPEPTAEPTKKGATTPRVKATATPAKAATPTAAPATPTAIPALSYSSRRFVKLELTPNQARVFLDSHLIGIVDDWDDSGGGAILAFLKEGKHRLRIAYPERRDVLIDLSISPSAPVDTVTIKGAMEAGASEGWTGPAPALKRPDYRTIGPIRFAVEPKDAVVEVNGYYRGPVAAYVSSDLQVPDMGVFEVKISAPGHETKIVRVLVAPSAGEAKATIKEKLKKAS